MIDRMGAVSTAHANLRAVMQDFVDEHCSLFNPGIKRCSSDSSISVQR